MAQTTITATAVPKAGVLPVQRVAAVEMDSNVPPSEAVGFRFAMDRIIT